MIYLLLFILNSPCEEYITNETDYNFILNIPKINLRKTVKYYKDKDNSVNKGIYLANNYNFSQNNDILILASHSGKSSISYFKHLDNLNINDYVITSNNKYKNIYKINEIYKINKNGKFVYDRKKKGIYLITCDKNENKKQLVFYGKRVKSIKKSTYF